MIVLSNTTRQTVKPGESITFNHVVLHTGTGECHKAKSDFIRMKQSGGIYEISFSCNARVIDDGVGQLYLSVNNDSMLETNMRVSNDQFTNVSSRTAIKNTEADLLTVTNTGNTDIEIDMGPSFFVKRVS